MARLSLSVPPLVNTTSDGRAPKAAAIDSRDSSTTRRARRPAACKDEALPGTASSAAMVMAASGWIGVVAAWSGDGIDASLTAAAGPAACSDELGPPPLLVQQMRRQPGLHRVVPDLAAAGFEDPVVLVGEVE